jgi:hypothetical protein
VDIVDAGIKRFVFRHFYRTAEGLVHLLNADVEVLLQHGNEFTRLTLDDFKQHIEQGRLNARD